MKENDGNGKDKELGGDNGFSKVKEPSVSFGGSTVSVNWKSEDGGNVKALIGKGIYLQMQNSGRLDFDSFSEAIKLDPQNACALTHCGILYTEEGWLMEAAESYQKELRVDPTYKATVECLAIVLMDIGTNIKLAGNTQEGIQKYFEALKVDPHYAPAYYNLGVVYSKMMQYDMALTFYEKKLHQRGLCMLKHIATWIWEQRVAYGEMLKFDMAIVLYELAFHFNPHCVEACNNLGVIYKDRDNLDKVVECYQLALSIKPKFSQSLNNLGVVYTVQGKMDAAASMIEKAIIANPKRVEAYNNLGVLYRDAGDIALAINAYEQCLKIDPDSRNAGQNRLLAMNYIDEGNDDKLFEAHRVWGRRFMSLYQQFTSWDNSKDPERPLVKGYVSPYYFTHCVLFHRSSPYISQLRQI
ncbi:hypothetical protein KIW84_012928 [Lathyrus oleraceus]|uniref:UDP-N-acetylglucosamine--peptide N-acetylglucosaminyltransferase SPINDLY n=1 Tax=Pisum sativum TaxID=3888 RepID=A0A9D5BIR1_PEA|nr:hypothetical protein KIW84_012928 [Pisum sativum]